MRLRDPQLLDRSPQADAARSAGFTLLEVVLAISIAAGILAVVLLFYHQTESLRSRLLEETSRLDTMRLVMERLSTELAAARVSGPYGQGLSGGGDNLQFVKLNFPNSWDRTNAPVSTTPASPLRLVTYSLVQDTNTTNNATDTGLVRVEESLAKASSLNASLVAATNDPSVALPPGTVAPHNGSVATQIQFLRFRYWDGSTWADAWSGPDLPLGVEVSLGADRLPVELTPDEYPFELYRRVIYLPNHAVNPVPNPAGAAITQAAR